jgi:hypothetical protein
MDKAVFHVGVFGIPAKLVDGVVRIKANVRGDEAEQSRQWGLAKLAPIPGVSIIDCPGGAVKPGDKSLEAALRREVAEETGGCKIGLLGNFSQAFEFMSEGTVEKPADLACWCPIRLIGEPKPSTEASAHPWISMAEFEAETPYRCVSGLGNKGRTGRMMRAALQWYEQNKHRPEVFS